MKKNLPLILLVAIQGLFALHTAAQSERSAFAITDTKKDGSSWIMLRRLDTKTGEMTSAVIDGLNRELELYDASNGGRTQFNIKDTNNLFQPQLPFSTGVAALAYDRKSNRLFYTPMYVDQLRYVDIATMKVYCVGGKAFNDEAGKQIGPVNTLSRMTIAGDGYGYTISSDGNHLYRFSTHGTPVISDLGSLNDLPGNNEMTIHNACGNAGGDMVADDDGHLYLITAINNVYQITINNLETKYIGKISGLPEKFTTNGAAVDHEGKILLSSSIYNEAYYKVDPANWKATAFTPRTNIYRSADLATGNLLMVMKKNNTSQFYAGNQGLIKLFPNPAEKSRFMVRLTNIEPGEYFLQLTDVLGQSLLQRKIIINAATHTETIAIPPQTSIGFYQVRIVNTKNKQVFSEKLMVNKLE
jgi:hypothetical protein